MVKFLFENGADILAADKEGRPPVYFAALHGRLDVVKFKLENGADIMAASKKG